MDDYIKRSDVLAKSSTMYYRSWTTGDSSDLIPTQAITASYVESIPPADVRPIVHGEWIKIDTSSIDGCLNTGQFTYGCSCCKEVYRSENAMSLLYMKYCPNCGADMTGEAIKMEPEA